MTGKRFIISGGGTGGHIYPAIAIADELKSRFPDAQFLFVGAEDRMEMEKVPKAGYAIEGLWISGIQRRLSLQNLAFPFKLISSLLKSRDILARFRPHVAIGTGGYASAPLLRVASAKKIPCLIQEQNSHAGITNKWLSGRVQRICVAYPGMEKFFPTAKIRLTGNPVRQDIKDLADKRDEACAYFDLDPEKRCLLILGGSLGARSINELVDRSLPLFEKLNLQLLWQCGKYYENSYKTRADKNITVLPFVERMDLAYSAADFIISRAGALSVSELCLVGKPVIFVPSPNVAEDHQTKNALALSDRNAAMVIPEKDLLARFEVQFTELVSSKTMQETFSKNIKTLAKPNAAQDIVNEIVGLLENKNGM